MIRLKSLHFVLDIPLYNQECLFVLGYDRLKASAIIEKCGGSPEMVEFIRTLRPCSGVTTEDGNTGRYLIYMKELPQRASQHGSLVHELFHLVEQVMDRIGMPLEFKSSSEAYAYLLGHVSAEAFNRIWNASNF